MERRTFKALLYITGRTPAYTEFPADDSIQAAAKAVHWAKGFGFVTPKYGRVPKADGKTYSGVIGPARTEAFVQIHETSPIKIGDATS